MSGLLSTDFTPELTIIIVFLRFMCRPSILSTSCQASRPSCAGSWHAFHFSFPIFCSSIVLSYLAFSLGFQPPSGLPCTVFNFASEISATPSRRCQCVNSLPISICCVRHHPHQYLVPLLETLHQPNLRDEAVHHLRSHPLSCLYEGQIQSCLIPSMYHEAPYRQRI